jgi:spore maturation protein CgeB
MLQATDPARFHPVAPDPVHAHDVAVVAKSRGVFRTAVADAIAEGIRPAIYGSGWEPFVDPELVVDTHIANDELPVVYSSVGVLLNDHWQTMYEWGFASNRLFDALACETPLISDDLAEITELFDGTVLTYRDAKELRTHVDAVLADPIRALARAARGREIVTRRHTFDHRAAQFLDALRRHGLVPFAV